MIRLQSAAFLLAVVSCASQAPFEGKKISELEMMIEGKPTVDEKRLRNLMKTQAGMRYTANQLDEDTRTLYNSGLVDDVIFKAVHDGDEVRVIATVKTRPPMGIPFLIRGNRSFRNETLFRQIGFEVETPLTPRTVEKVRRNLESFYKRQGYHNVRISVKPQRDRGAEINPPGMDHLTFLIEEGPKR